MADKPSKSDQHAQKKQAEPPQKTPQQTKKHCGSGGIFVIFIALVAIAIAGVSLLYSYQLSQKMAHRDAQHSSVSSAVDQYSERLNEFASKSELQKALIKQQSEMDSVSSALNEVRLKSQQDNSAWVLAEVDYLIKLANFNLLYDANVDVARNILQAADQRAKALSSANAPILRAALANDLAKLEAIEKIDRQGIVLRLSALSEMVAKLPVTDHKTALDNEAQPNADSEHKDWRVALQSSLSFLKNAVVVRRIDAPLKPLMSPQQHRNLVENIQLQLSMASWAVLHRDQPLFEHALQEAHKWINDYLKQTDATQALVTGIDQLMQKNIAPQLPTLESSIKAVKQAFNSQVQQLNASEATQQKNAEQLLSKNTSLEVLSS